MELRSIAPRLRLTAATLNYNLKHFFDKYERNKIWPGDDGWPSQDIRDNWSTIITLQSSTVAVLTIFGIIL